MHHDVCLMCDHASHHRLSRRRKAGQHPDDSDDEDDDAVSADAFSAMCHKHGISPPSSNTLNAGIGIVESVLADREDELAAEGPLGHAHDDVAIHDDSDNDEPGTPSDSSGEQAGRSGQVEGDSTVMNPDLDEDLHLRAHKERRRSVAKTIAVLQSARGSLNRLLLIMQGRSAVLRAADKLKTIVGKDDAESTDEAKHDPATAALDPQGAELQPGHRNEPEGDHEGLPLESQIETHSVEAPPNE